MWTCPKCGRTFKRQEQSHYCVKAPETIEEYIAVQPEEIQQYLKTSVTLRTYLKGVKNGQGCIIFFRRKDEEILIQDRRLLLRAVKVD